MSNMWKEKEPTMNCSNLDTSSTESQDKLGLLCLKFKQDWGPLFNYNGSQTSHPPLHAIKESGNNQSKLKNKDVAGVSSLQKKPIRSTTTSGSSDGEEAEGEINMKGNMDSSDAKRAKRMLANRESARRSRSKKQAHITELETQVSQLRDENRALKAEREASRTHVSQLRDANSSLSHKNIVLNARVETLEAQVELLQEKAKIGMHPGLNPMTGMPYVPVHARISQ